MSFGSSVRISMLVHFFSIVIDVAPYCTVRKVDDPRWKGANDNKSVSKEQGLQRDMLRCD